MADLTKIMNVSITVYRDVIKKVLNALMQGGCEQETMNIIFSFFPAWTAEQVFIAGFTVGRLAEMENQRRGRHEHFIYINSDPDEEPEYADKTDK